MRHQISNGSAQRWSGCRTAKMLGFATALVIATIGGREIVGEPAVFYIAPVVAMIISMLPTIARRLPPASRVAHLRGLHR